MQQVSNGAICIGRTQLSGCALVSMLEHLATKSHCDKAVHTAPPTAVRDERPTLGGVCAKGVPSIKGKEERKDAMLAHVGILGAVIA